MSQILAQPTHSNLDEAQDASAGGDPTSPNTKFVSEKFRGLLEGEKCIGNYSCAVSLKILIQGRLYVTTKRLCFHSYFNDKTIFGKETKIAIPFSNIKRMEKKSNVFVFPNSISVVTKEGKEIFITSFVYRDQAYEVMHKQLEFTNGGVLDSRRSSEEQIGL
jgi:hypothetical protein